MKQAVTVGLAKREEMLARTAFQQCCARVENLKHDIRSPFTLDRGRYIDDKLALMRELSSAIALKCQAEKQWKSAVRVRKSLSGEDRQVVGGVALGGRLVLSELELTEYIRTHPHDPNCCPPSREQYRAVAEYERQQRVQAAVEEQRHLGLDRLRRENAELHRANADLARRIAKLELLVGANEKAGRNHVMLVLKGCRVLLDRVKKLEQRPVDAVNLDIDYDGERTLRLGAGDAAKFFTLPIPIDRGPYRQGQFYSRGDVISHHGSCWIAQAAGMLAKPPSDDWRLAVQRGRDAPERRAKGGVVA